MNTKTSSNPFFSVVVPVYNKEPHIYRSIGSVLNQTFQDFDLLIVNDASTDNSLKEILKFNDSRIKIFNRDKPGPGGYAARNLGIKMAQTNWIAFLDADDAWYPDHLEEIYQLIKEFSGTALVCTSWNDFYNNQEPRPNLFHISMVGIQRTRLSFKGYLEKSVSVAFPFCSSAVAIKKNVLLEVGGFPEDKCRRGGDVDTWLRIMAYSKEAAWSSKITAQYYRDSVNMVTKIEPFTAKWDRISVDRIILSISDRQTITLLKRYANKRIIDRYLQSRLTGKKSDENLCSLIFISHLNFKQLLIVTISIFPDKLINSLYSFARFTNQHIVKKNLL